MHQFPRGTVTFLFTDIEGSTRLWHDHADAMPDAYARHDEVLRDAFARHGGVVFKTVGDAFQVAFPTASDAVAAASAAQEALQSGAWPLPEPLRVRMALHTGAVDPDADGDYRSPVLNRLGRLLNAGHGGQVLLSQATMELARDHLPAGVTLQDLGDQRLKDLYRPERVFQLAAPGLIESFPPLRTLDRHPNNLPMQLTQFIGRADVVDAVRSLLERPDVRLVTITGPGGIGKTRLALQVGADVLDRFSDGVYFVRLDTLTDAAQVPAAMAQALGLRERTETPVPDTLTGFLRDKEMLLIADNVEQVIESATFIGEMLVACPGLKVIATSRIRLHLRGEREFPLEPLSLPDLGARSTPDSLSQYESVRLFVERAQAVKPAFVVTNENAPAVAEMCARLDGLPLAIELAAARVRMMPPEALLKRFASRLPVLTGGARDLPERQQTLRSAIAWSYELLSEGDQALFRRMSVFAGGATLEAIEAVAVDEGDAWEAFDGLQRLVDHNLVRSTDDAGEPRFQMYETIREFGLAELERHGEAAEAFQRHATHFAGFDPYEADYQTSWIVAEIERIDTEQENIRAACAWAIDHDVALAYRLVAGHGFSWYWRGVRREELDWIRRVYALPVPEVTPFARARFLLGATYAILSGPVDEATSKPLLRDLRESVDVFRGGGHVLWSRRALTVLAIHEQQVGNAGQAMALMRELIDLARGQGDDLNLALALNNAGYFAYLHGDLDEGLDYLDDAMLAARNVPAYPDVPGVVMSSRGDVLRALGRFSEAEEMYREALRLVVSLRRPEDTTSNIMGLILVTAATGREDLAVCLGAALHALEARQEFLIQDDLAAMRREVEETLQRLRVDLGDAAFDRAWAEGWVLTPEEMLARLDAAVALGERGEATA